MMHSSASRWSLSIQAPTEDMEEDSGDSPVLIWRPEGVADDAVRQVQISCHDKTGLGCDVTRLFLEYGLHVLKADISTDGKWAFLIFLVRACDPAVPANWGRLEKELHYVIPSEHKEITRRLLRLEDPKPICAAHVLEISGGSCAGGLDATPLPLRALMHTLWEADCTVFSAHMAAPTGEWRPVHKLWVLDDLRQLPEPSRCAAICSAVRTCLGSNGHGDHAVELRPAASSDAGDWASGIADTPAGTHTHTPANTEVAGSLGTHGHAHDEDTEDTPGAPLSSSSRDSCATTERGADTATDAATTSSTSAVVGVPTLSGGAGSGRGRSYTSRGAGGSSLGGGGMLGSLLGGASAFGPRSADAAALLAGACERSGCKDCTWDAPLNRKASGMNKLSSDLCKTPRRFAQDDNAFLAEWIEGTALEESDSSGEAHNDVCIEIDTESSTKSTVMSVTCADRKGLLYDQFRMLKDSAFKVQYASVEVLPGGRYQGNLVLREEVAALPGTNLWARDADAQAELVHRLRVTVLQPLRISVCPGPDDVDGRATSTVTIMAQTDSGRRGRPRVTFDVCAAFGTLQLVPRSADVYMESMRVGGSRYIVETHAFRVSAVDGRPLGPQEHAALECAVADALLGAPPLPTDAEGDGDVDGLARSSESVEDDGHESVAVVGKSAENTVLRLATSWAYM